MKTRTRLLALLLAASTLPLSQAFFPGCATLTNGTRQEIRVRSKPGAAQVFLNGKKIGTTPTTAFVSRWGSHRVRIELPGYLPYEVKLEKRYNQNAGGNLFIGGVWIVVDALTGAIFEQAVPASAHQPPWGEFDNAPLTAIDFNPPLYVVTHLKPDPAARKIGQMLRR
jgi:hypothetical protein